MKNCVIIMVLFAGIAGNAQNTYYNAENKNKLKALNWMIGNWEGSGWAMDSQTRKKEVFTQQEIVKYDLDSTIIIVHGIGKSEDKIIHDAYAIISVNPKGGYFMTSFLGDGREGKYELHQIEDGKWEWTIPTPSGTVIYTINADEKYWKEVGDFDMNGSKYPFFEMNLNKKQ